MLKKVDLHIHSTFSDGDLTPSEILNVCNKEKIGIISITDHDNFDGVKKIIKDNPYPDITIIPGIELSAFYKNGTLHILGYNFNINDPILNQISAELDRFNRIKLQNLIIELEKDYNIHFKEREIDDIFLSDGTVGRPYIARLLVKYNYTPSVKVAFKSILNPLKKKIPNPKLDISAYECIKYIKGAGGLSCIAHPITLKKDIISTLKYIECLQRYGLNAIEVFHSLHLYSQEKSFITIANQLGLLISGGSDFHGPNTKADIKIWSGKNNNLNLTDNLTIIQKIRGDLSAKKY